MEEKNCYLDRIVVELMTGLMTDGAHYKQHYLESALRMLCDDKYVDSAKEELKWDSGIPS